MADADVAARRSAWRAPRIAELAAMKVAAGCIDCGYNAHPAALQWDHRPGEVKLGNIAKMIERAWDVVLAEVAKCDVRCANCHAIKSAERGYTGGRAFHAAVLDVGDNPG